MLTGRIVRFEEERGFGFIAPEGGAQEDVFFHVNGVDGGEEPLAIGTKVSFEVVEGQRGLKAYGVQVVGVGAVKAAESANQVVPVASTATRVDAEELCDVLTRQELRSEVTEQLLQELPELTGAQVQSVRDGVVALAGKHGWLVE
ncbi:cold-shock protein [Saccharopolyspora phatthalungensis]|uniref:Cold shock CspA family protein n=1 Tax=Saccharopolyspora phatthalungensis TaxID=664693 RepID=A0A840QIP7_9PSEU|nr:cold shock domain-containing protein [Saccharopolyspora phatthalungensis]MBB5158505.1 cold shock CspA family protein [Saccharopolyspora phatthalungensis]